MTWGLEGNVVERFTGAGAEKKNISFERDTYEFNFPGSPSAFLATFRNFYGPTVNAFAAAEQNGRAVDQQKELEALFRSQNKSEVSGVTTVHATCLRVTVTA